VRQYRAAKVNEHEEFYLADEELHAAVAAISRNPRAWAVALAEKVQLDRVRYLDLDVRADLADLARQHQAIVDAIVDRDEHLAEATMRAHLRNVYRSIEQLTTSHHAFFEGESIERPSPL
jgi:DNA-binding GntR family transcriptional regulator